MPKVNKHYIFILLTLLIPFTQLSANTTPWAKIKEEEFAKQDMDRQIIPQTYLTFALDMVELQTIVSKAPSRFSSASYGPPVVLALPMPNGKMERFQIFDAPIMHPDLAIRYPMLHAYAGIGLDDKTASLRFNITPLGFQAMVTSGKQGTVLIDPYARGNTTYYITYYKKDYHRTTHYECYASDDINTPSPYPSTENVRANDVMRTYRLALGCTYEYSTYHGGNKPDVMAALHNVMTRVNGIYERDVAVSMQMVPNNDELIFVDINDPYDESSFSMMDIHQMVCDDVIGNENYDIGLVLATAVGGSAYRSSACMEGMKGAAVAGFDPPIGDILDVDFVSHEFGHQYGCSHVGNECNTTRATSVEPGSASTIMSQYNCDVQIQAVSDGYFNAINILEINDHLQEGPPSSCPTETQTGNTAPVAEALKSHYTLPVSTPFRLTAVGSDPDGDALTYCWEQMNNERVDNPPQPTYTEGPAFRSREPVAEPYRYFPAIDYIISGTNYEFEVLPSVTRTMDFKVTVRDNFMGSGATDYDDVHLDFTDLAGPFLIQSPNTNQIWYEGTSQTVIWDVANTDEAPVSCASVDILLSIDGGYTYPITLASNVPNDGAQAIEVPEVESSTARVMVFCSDNAFFDISDEDFTIAQATSPTVAVAVDAPSQQACGAEESVVYNISFTASADFQEEISLEAAGVPTGATYSFSPNNFTPAAQVSMTIEGLENVTAGIYTIEVTGTSNSTTIIEEVTLEVNNSLPDPIILESPANWATGTSYTPTFTWSGSSNNSGQYIEIAKSPQFGPSTVEVSPVSSNSYTPTVALAPFSVYYWRIRSENICASSVESTAWFVFQTGGEGCQSYSNSTPAYVHGYISDATSTITVDDILTIFDANVALEIFHKNIGDLTVHLNSPGGTTIELFNRPGVPASPFGCSRDNMLVILDDEATNTANELETTCISGATYGIEGTFRPIEPLAELIGQSAEGDWTITMFDDKHSHAGSVDNWSIELCYMQVAGEAPTFSKMELAAPTIGTALVLSDNLLATSPTSTASQIYYTLLSLPTEGYLTINGEIAIIGDSFSQEDIDNNLLTYTTTNANATMDQFRFDIVTRDGGWIHDEFLNIDIGGVSSVGELRHDIAFELFPNPSKGDLTLIINQPTAAELTVIFYDMTGKAVHHLSIDKHEPYFLHQLELSYLPAGIYAVVLTDGKSVGQQRFIKI
jgi:subtilisin-like proprotein convertase family protein